MRKLYSLVLMAAALLIGTNAWADASVSTWAQLEAALQTGGTVTLSNDINVIATNDATWRGIWIGCKEENGTAPVAVLNMNGYNITINSGNYVSSGKTQDQALIPFILTKGSLKIESASPAKIEVVKGQSVVSSSTNVFFVFGGVNSKVNPKGENPFSYLEIGENVTIQTQNGTAIAIDRLNSAHTAISGLAASVKPNYGMAGSGFGFAYGARVEVKGTLISQGAESSKKEQDSKTKAWAYKNKCYGIKANGNIKTPEVADTAYAPYIHIHPSALIQSDNRSGSVGDTAIMAGATAVYASGYAQWLVEGNCNGATGVYIGAGKVTINDALVKSAATEYNAAGAGGHANGSGSAIVINSRSGREGETEVTVSGDTKAEATNGYAFEEKVNTSNGETKVESITIAGGTFEGSQDKGALLVTETTAAEAEITVSGGNVNGKTGVIGVDSLATYLNNQGGTHVTMVTNASGNSVLVISEGNAPDPAASIEEAESASVKLTANDTIESGVVELVELTMDQDTLLIKKGATLKVERVILNKDAQIIVKAGAKLIVTGEQGIVAPVPENIVLEASEYEGQAIFLFNPAVKSNRHPNATVEFISNSITDGAKYSKQRFGIPTFGQLKSMTTKNGGEDVQTAMSKFYSEDNAWHDFGWINVDGMPQNLDQMADPFAYYQMQHNTASKGTVVAMSGELYGNENPVLAIKGNSWNGFANSFMAPIDGGKLIEMIPNTVDKSFQIYEINKKTDKGSWVPVSLLELENIRPMQAFLIRNTAAAADAEVEYEGAVYCPIVGGCAPLSARRSEMGNITRAKLIVEGEEGMDRLTIAEDVQFSVEFDNGYDAAKYMNDELNIYVTADEKMGIFATDNLENTFVGFQTVKGGNYTIEFANVQGEELTLIDHETGARVAMVEGSVYEFTANGTNDYRFEIVKSANAPTAIENTEAVKSVKGIYTITGQYVGEMNVWNSLPAGVYVVNGAKLVK